MDRLEADIRLLSQALERNPSDIHYIVELGHRYFESNQIDLALRSYNRYLSMGGLPEERFACGYRGALCYQRLNREADFEHQVLTLYEKFPHRPAAARAGPLLPELTPLSARLPLRPGGAEIPRPAAGPFIEPEVYQWRLRDIMAVSLYWLGRNAEALKINYELLAVAPESQRPRLRATSNGACEARRGGSRQKCRAAAVDSAQQAAVQIALQSLTASEAAKPGESLPAQQP